MERIRRISTCSRATLCLLAFSRGCMHLLVFACARLPVSVSMCLFMRRALNLPSVPASVAVSAVCIYVCVSVSVSVCIGLCRSIAVCKVLHSSVFFAVSVSVYYFCLSPLSLSKWPISVLASSTCTSTYVAVCRPRSESTDRKHVVSWVEPNVSCAEVSSAHSVLLQLYTRISLSLSLSPTPTFAIYLVSFLVIIFHRRLSLSGSS